MKFSEAVRKTNDIHGAYKKGLQALQRRDLKKITVARTSRRNLSGSIALDKALSKKYPEDPRWDYGIGIAKTRSADKVIWMEIHPAKASEVKAMISKLRWLKNWLENHAEKLKAITDVTRPYIWIASGNVSLQKTSPQARMLALSGISFPREYMQIE